MKKTGPILTEAIDPSGGYRHLAEIFFCQDLTEKLTYGKSLLSNARQDCTLTFYTDSCTLFKLRDRIEEVFPCWQEMLEEKQFCFIAEFPETGEIKDEEISDVWYSEVRINSEAEFSLLITCHLDEDGGIIQYETPWLSIHETTG